MLLSKVKVGLCASQHWADSQCRGWPRAEHGPPQVSARWFPANERTISTGIGVSLSNLGSSSHKQSNLLGPSSAPASLFHLLSSFTLLQCFVPSPYHSFPPIIKLLYIGSGVAFLIGPLFIDWIGLTYFLWLTCAVSAVLCLATVIYFPDAPPSPPSISEGLSEQHQTLNLAEYKAGVVLCLKNVSFMVSLKVHTLDPRPTLTFSPLAFNLGWLCSAWCHGCLDFNL